MSVVDRLYMKKIHWDEGLSVGDAALDDEHKQLIALVNRLTDLIDDTPDVEQVHRILDELERLAIVHSRHEERIGGGLDEKVREQHRREHGEFRSAIMEARNLLKGEDLSDSLIDMAETLVKLLVTHIVDQDLDYASHFAQRDINARSLAEYLVHQFQKISFVRGLEMLVMVSLLPMLIFAAMIMYQSWQTASLATDAGKLARLTQQVGDLVHELQRERGLSSGFLTSDDRAFTEALRLQRRRSDHQTQKYLEYPAEYSVERDSYLLSVARQVERVGLRLEILQGLRADVDAKRIRTQVSFDRFTSLISELLELSDLIANVARQQGASDLFQANAVLIQFGEMAGQERGVGAAGFGRGRFTRQEYTRLVSLVTEQRLLQRQFRTFIDEPQWVEWRQHLEGDVVIAYQRLSDYALEYGSGLGSVSVDGFTWFRVATQRINLIYEFQQQLMQSLRDEMKRKGSAATAMFMATVFGGGAMVLLIGFVALQLAKSIRLPILSLTEGMRALTADDKTLRIPFANRKDELGDMVTAYETFRRKLIRNDLLTMGEEMGPLAARRHALALRRRTQEGEEYKRLASIDSLTGLLNRREFMRRAKTEVSRLKRHEGVLSVVLLDVDHFKWVNDTYGHAAGDRVLKIIAQTTASALREEDVLGRIGGEEFAAFLPATNKQAAVASAERIRTSIESLRIQLAEDELEVSVSIGVSEYTDGELSIDKALMRADKALYRAKEEGRNRVISYPVI